ncbi:hypothetical protein [Bordetella trematum]|uniref:hypothetical protein n=1 Tax=Bordetella trematum TaxID=123899 RepID=UPI000D8FCF6A|nr:hypothetical protein [Bordetella trematum]SPU49866.1 phage-related putative membrane protein [Bordetella trematum]VDH07611.1 Uncharacterised protein [Bordetella trematum]
MLTTSPIRPVRSDCGTYGLIRARTQEERRAELEADLARELRRALQLDQNVVFHYASGPSTQRASDFVHECGDAQADRFFAQLVAHGARPGESEAVLASLVRRWLVLCEAQAVQVLADAVDDRQRITFEARQ